jgi:hypothetical protein
MTTKSSPPHMLRRQAETVAETLKKAERGDKFDAKYTARIAEARERGSFSVGIVMDDKVIKLDISWATIHETTEAALVEYILDLMRETKKGAIQ